MRAGPASGRRLAYAEAIFDRDAAVGEAELKLANGAASLKAFRAAAPLANPSSASQIASLPSKTASASASWRRSRRIALAAAVACALHGSAFFAFAKGRLRGRLLVSGGVRHSGRVCAPGRALGAGLRTRKRFLM